METIQIITERCLDKIVKNRRIKKLKNDLEYKTNHNYNRKSIRKTYVKLFRLLSCKIKKMEKLFPPHVGDPTGLSIYFCDNRRRVAFSNILQFNNSKINNLNNYVSI